MFSRLARGVLFRPAGLRRSGARGPSTGKAFFFGACALLLSSVLATAQMSHEHGSKQPCEGATLACATKVTPTFAPDGSLWLAWDAGGYISVARSTDFGQTFSPAVAVNPEPMSLDWGPDARPAITVDRQGRIAVAFDIFKDKEFNGQVFYTHSEDSGRTFARPAPITADAESQRFQAVAFDPDGTLFAAWFDKRNRAPARARGEKYAGAALAFAWSSDHGATFSETRLARDNTCECCRLGVAFAGPGRPILLFRNIFEGSIRDHAITTFVNPTTPGPVYLVSVDDWRIEACPHHGPSLAVAPNGDYHVTWFTSGRVRQGLFYAHSSDGGQTFSQPRPIGNPARAPARPSVLAVANTLWLAWKEFDGTKTTVQLMASHDGGNTWSASKAIAETGDSSDHPLLVTNGSRAFLSWQTHREGYRLISLEEFS
jgi:hypothetical protein